MKTISLQRINRLMWAETKLALLPILIIAVQQWTAVLIIIFMPEARAFLVGWMMNLFGYVFVNLYFLNFRNQRRYRLGMLPVTRQESFLARLGLRFVLFCWPFILPLLLVGFHGLQTMTLVAARYTLPGVVLMALLTAHVLLFLDLSIYYAENQFRSYGAKMLAISPLIALWMASFFDTISEGVFFIYFNQPVTQELLASYLLLAIITGVLIWINYQIFNSGNFQRLAGIASQREVQHG